MRAKGKRAALPLLLLVGAVSTVACVDEDVVFDERPGFQEVAEEAGGFVGYADPSSEDELTVCGACHTGTQAQWEATAHSDAWAALQQVGQFDELCEACHSTNSFGNVVPEPAGEPVGGHAAIATEDGRYLDVQCESCHGPGLDHARQPTETNGPLAPFVTGEALSFGCGECHQGFHHPFVEEWELSAHGDVLEFAATNQEDGCYLCHSGEGGLQLLGVDSDYLQKDELLASEEAFAQITCAVCHDPHGSPFSADLRLPVETTDTDQHLCSACHDLQPRPDTDLPQEWITTHSPETGLMNANAGWFPPGSGIDPGELTHPHTQADQLCASCHVATYETTDQETGLTFSSKGHRFLAAPCVDENGLPLAPQWCELTAEAREFRSCLECHDSEEQTVALLRQSVDDLLPRVRTLASLLFRIDPNGAAPGGEIGPGFRFTVADGAFFNLSVALSADGLPADDESARIALAAALMHNPRLVEALVDESIAALRAEYGSGAGAAAHVVVPDSWWGPWSEH